MKTRKNPPPPPHKNTQSFKTGEKTDVITSTNTLLSHANVCFANHTIISNRCASEGDKFTDSFLGNSVLKMPRSLIY